jgi:hypothetical protein
MEPLVNPCEGCTKNIDINNAVCGRSSMFPPETWICDKFILRVQYQARLERDKEWVEWLEKTLNVRYFSLPTKGGCEHFVFIDATLPENEWQTLKDSVK